VNVTTAHELAGQSIMFRFPGPAFTEEIRAVFRQIRPGGVILFGDNISSRIQINLLCRELQAEAKALGMPPLLIAIDQEGGLVSRLNADPDFVTPPGPMALTATGDPRDIERAYEITSEQLREAGINTDFAPVVDVNNNHANPVIRTRSFGDNVDIVIAGGLAAIEGLHRAGLAATVKHFPGHGDTHVDSHLGLPVIDHPMERLRAVELAPFQAAIDAGVAGVMTTHIVFPAIDEHPATLSKRILTDLLRGEMGFQGVIFTDSMSMDAIEDRYGHAESTLMAKAAGVDMLEANETPEIQLTRHAAMVEAIETVRLDRAIFEATLERLNVFRKRFGITHNVPDLAPVPLQRAADALAIAGRTVTLLSDPPFQPLRPGDRGILLDFQRFRGTEAEDPVHRGPLVRNLMAGSLPGIEVVTVPNDPAPEDITRALDTTNRSLLIVFTRDATDNRYQVEIARQGIASLADGARVIHVALRGPYDLGLIPEATDRIAIYGDPAVSLQALVIALSGHAEIAGTSPITV
jgi:beta-N-acetylhexosaminidase